MKTAVLKWLCSMEETGFIESIDQCFMVLLQI